MMATISLQFPENELNLFQSYAKVNDMSLSELIRKTMLERIEDEYDQRVFEEYEKDKAEGNVQTYSHNEVWAEFGL